MVAMADPLRPQIMAQASPIHRVQHASARAERMARPMNLLGSPPGIDIPSITELARALSSAQAAAIPGPLSPPPTGGLFTASA